MTLFEDFNETFDAACEGRGQLFGELVRTPHRPLGKALARLKNLRSLSASFSVDAKDFFCALISDRYSGKPWEKLSKLSLTSQLLSPTSSCDDIDSLLLLAAVAARRLPNLCTLEIWYGRRGHALLFRYKVLDRGVAEISCLGTQKLALRPHIEKTWEGVSERRLRIAPSRVFDSGLIESHGDAIHHLGLQVSVVHPQSLRQIRREQQRPTGNNRPESSLEGVSELLGTGVREG